MLNKYMWGEASTAVGHSAQLLGRATHVECSYLIIPSLQGFRAVAKRILHPSRSERACFDCLGNCTYL